MNEYVFNCDVVLCLQYPAIQTTILWFGILGENNTTISCPVNARMSQISTDLNKYKIISVIRRKIIESWQAEIQNMLRFSSGLKTNLQSKFWVSRLCKLKKIKTSQHFSHPHFFIVFFISWLHTENDLWCQWTVSIWFQKNPNVASEFFEIAQRRLILSFQST